jgi:rod shape-determining protein MreD
MCAVLILLQVLLMNQISLFGIGTPILYVYFLTKLPMGSNRFYVITLGFIVGFIIDIFLNTPGMNAAATTIVAVMRKPLMNLFFSKDDEFEDFVPGIYRSSGAFVRFVVAMVLLHQSLLFFIGAFSFFNLTNTLIRIGASSLITLVLIFAIDSLMYKKVASEQ